MGTGNGAAAVDGIFESVGLWAGAAVEIKDDGVKFILWSGFDQLGNIANLDGHPGITSRPSGQFREGPNAPLLNHRIKFGNHHFGCFRELIQNCPQGDPHSQTTDQNL